MLRESVFENREYFNNLQLNELDKDERDIWERYLRKEIVLRL